MNLCDSWVEIEAVPFDGSIYQAFDLFRSHPDWPFLPVVDENGFVKGVVREYDLKKHAYAMFGRDLVKRRSTSDFLRPTLVLPVNVSEKELLDSSAQNSNPDGIVLSDNGKYRAVLLTQTILGLFEQRHRETELRLVQAQKMEAIGTLAGGIAHDLNNILTPILGYAELMTIMRQQGSPMKQEIIDQISVSARRARESVKQILTFSRHQRSERSPMSLGRVVKEALPLLRSTLPTTIDIEMHLNTPQDTVLVNADEMHRVILNLCTNAYHAMRERGGSLRIMLDRHQGPVLGWSTHDELLLGDHVRLSVSDTGIGIDPERLPRIFEPFFTTKKQGEGTGLGLSVVHGIVSRCNGVISVESVVGKGSTFHLYLPVAAGETQRSATQTGSTNPVKHEAVSADKPKARILFVDDEFSITRLASMLLPQYGIAVETENDSQKALVTFREHSEDFDLLVTDQTMPGITGVDLTREILRVRPDMPVILCTGYSETVSPEQARAAGICEYILKPPDFQQMAATIQRLVFPAIDILPVNAENTARMSVTVPA